MCSTCSTAWMTPVATITYRKINPIAIGDTLEIHHSEFDSYAVVVDVRPGVWRVVSCQTRRLADPHGRQKSRPSLRCVPRMPPCRAGHAFD
jgi:hypothetical protein